MKKILRIAVAVILSLIITVSLVLCTSATDVFDDGAYASIVTGSDFQGCGLEAYNRFDRVLCLMKADGLEQPHSMLMGGDFTMVLLDNAIPGIAVVKNTLKAAYPDFDTDNAVFLQGNHDNTCSGFTKTGFYNMGEYYLYAINENDFPWRQDLKGASAEKKVKALAAEMENKFIALIESGDSKPIIVITHVPLHHTYRYDGGDNQYSEYVFDVLNKAGEKLDIIYLFGHNHSNPFDDYIGGSINFFTVGDTIRVPDMDNVSETVYKEKTLNFTYTNCGYIGYSKNSNNEYSTDVLTLGVIRLLNNAIRFVKYSEDGVAFDRTVARKNAVVHGGELVKAEKTELINAGKWETENKIIQWLLVLLYRVMAVFKIS